MSISNAVSLDWVRLDHHHTQHWRGREVAALARGELKVTGMGTS
jgi:hypothetical protein